MQTEAYHYTPRGFDQRHVPADAWSPSDFQRGAIEAAFFTCDPFISSGEYCLDWDDTWNKLPAGDRARFIERCNAFVAKFGKLLDMACEATGSDMACAGRDYHYTSAGHGCGFWDGDWKVRNGRDFGELLTRAAKQLPLPEIHAEVDCEDYREGRGACRDCDGCESGASYWLE